jgi:hypothetical protein
MLKIDAFYSIFWTQMDFSSRRASRRLRKTWVPHHQEAHIGRFRYQYYSVFALCYLPPENTLDLAYPSPSSPATLDLSYCQLHNLLVLPVPHTQPNLILPHPSLRPSSSCLAHGILRLSESFSCVWWIPISKRNGPKSQPIWAQRSAVRLFGRSC